MNINRKIKDIDTIITGHGVHNRVIAFFPKFDRASNSFLFHARVDHVNGLRDPSIAEILKVARKKNGTKGVYALTDTHSYKSERGTNCTSFTFKKLMKGGDL